MKKKFATNQKNADSLLQALYNFSHYSDIGIETIDAHIRILKQGGEVTALLRLHEGDLGVAALQLFMEYRGAKTAHGRIALCAALHKLTDFIARSKKPAPIAGKTPISANDLNDQFTKEIRDAA